MAEGETVTPVKVLSTIPEKPLVLLREDSKHALVQISSLISAEDYEVLGNHSTEAMRESGLFSVA